VTASAKGLAGFAVKFISGLTVRVMADDVTALLGTDPLAVSATVSVGVLKVPADPATDAAWQFALLVLIGQLKPEGKLFGVNVYPPKPGVVVGTV
jgi:hypothetical protein